MFTLGGVPIVSRTIKKNHLVGDNKFKIKLKKKYKYYYQTTYFDEILNKIQHAILFSNVNINGSFKRCFVNSYLWVEIEINDCMFDYIRNYETCYGNINIILEQELSNVDIYKLAEIDDFIV